MTEHKPGCTYNDCDPCSCGASITEQPVGCPDLDAMHLGIPNKTEQPNTNAMIVKTIQGLMSVINNELDKLNEETKYLSCHRNSLVLRALEEIDVFEKTTLYELQKAFE